MYVDQPYSCNIQIELTNELFKYKGINHSNMYSGVRSIYKKKNVPKTRTYVTASKNVETRIFSEEPCGVRCVSLSGYRASGEFLIRTWGIWGFLLASDLVYLGMTS
jgi:hypothetical protein